MTVRRPEPAGSDAALALGPDASCPSAGWSGPPRLAASGHARATASRTGRVLAVACTSWITLGVRNPAPTRRPPYSPMSPRGLRATLS
ncbi:hypothetical protein [Streptomyces sp. NPDC008092]|uniref:hypothetical protein n=1 Tax=Streptomyces sp. NPDC008092 TaxID=3364808 RepID=UPI0036E8F8EA